MQLTLQLLRYVLKLAMAHAHVHVHAHVSGWYMCMHMYKDIVIKLCEASKALSVLILCDV